MQHALRVEQDRGPQQWVGVIGFFRCRVYDTQGHLEIAVAAIGLAGVVEIDASRIGHWRGRLQEAWRGGWIKGLGFAKQCQIGAQPLPQRWVIDKQQRVRYYWNGELEWQGAGGYKKLTRLIEELLIEKGPPAKPKP